MSPPKVPRLSETIKPHPLLIPPVGWASPIIIGAPKVSAKPLSRQQALRIMLPIRCYTCNKVIDCLWMQYVQAIESQKTPAEALDAMGVTRTCCRARFITSVNDLHHAQALVRRDV